jgi:2,3-bisphosphoglycerate-dependent phosphoglycerate mutase
MEVIVVRHGESEGNVEKRLQGRIDSPLSDRGRAQARRLGAWLRRNAFRWDAAYASPLQRARETAEIVADVSGYPQATLDPDLRELDAGDLEGLNLEDMLARYPDFMNREITDLGDFAEFGGESYEDAQHRVRRLVSRLVEHHKEGEQRVLLVAHGGFNFQLVKAVACVPVPRVAIIRWGNCTATRLVFRERRGIYMAEVTWHVPIELMGGEGTEGTSEVFR